MVGKAGQINKAAADAKRKGQVLTGVCIYHCSPEHWRQQVRNMSIKYKFTRRVFLLRNWPKDLKMAEP